MQNKKKNRASDSRSSLEKALENSSFKNRYLKEAEKLFMGAKGTAGHERALERLHDSWGKKNFSRVAEEYIRQYGLPDEWSALILLLDLEGKPELVCDVIKRLVEKAPCGTAAEKRGLESRLRIMEMTSMEPAIQEAAQDALSRLK